MILANYTVKLNSNEYSVNADSKLQKISPIFPHIDDTDFWNKLNLALIEYCNMDIEKLEKYLTEVVKGEPLRRMHIFIR